MLQKLFTDLIFLGEALDKGARLLGIRSDKSGGAAIEQMALKGDPKKYPLSVPLQSKPNCNFSYAGRV